MAKIDAKIAKLTIGLLMVVLAGCQPAQKPVSPVKPQTVAQAEAGVIKSIETNTHLSPKQKVQMIAQVKGQYKAAAAAIHSSNSPKAQ